jgi:pilus assembly protein Flp/PilA
MRSALAHAFQSVCNPSHEDIARLATDSRGVTAIEYALIAALIAVAAIAAFTLVGTDLSNTFSFVASQL